MADLVECLDHTVIGAFRREWRRSPVRLVTMAAVQLVVGIVLGVALALWMQR